MCCQFSQRFIGEETVSSSNYLPELTDAPTWIIDPIDGTTNFVHSFPHACISIALAVNKKLEIGIVYNPVLEQMFTARRGHGAYLNGRRIKSSSVDGELIFSFYFIDRLKNSLSVDEKRQESNLCLFYEEKIF